MGGNLEMVLCEGAAYRVLPLSEPASQQALRGFMAKLRAPRLEINPRVSPSVMEQQ